MVQLALMALFNETWEQNRARWQFNICNRSSWKSFTTENSTRWQKCCTGV